MIPGREPEAKERRRNLAFLAVPLPFMATPELPLQREYYLESIRRLRERAIPRTRRGYHPEPQPDRGSAGHGGALEGRD
ncbi:hypothetical protein D9M68_873640 [compost metagenome]